MSTNSYSIERMKIVARVGIHSLVGVNTSHYPVRRGNYFSFISEEYCANMWAENLEEACDRFLDDNLVEVDIVSYDYDTFTMKWAIVVDERIPDEWLHDGPYFCGCRSIPAEILKSLVDKYDWDYDIAEKYIDPVSYYGRQEGCTYNPETGVVSYRFNEEEIDDE